MNEQPTKGMSGGIEEPREEPLVLKNPYRVDAAGPDSAAGPYDPQAEGLTGDALDALMKARFTEGVEKGRADQRQVDEARFAEIFDRAAGDGLRAGYDRGRQDAIGITFPALRIALEAFQLIVRKTGSREIKETCATAARSIEEQLG